MKQPSLLTNHSHETVRVQAGHRDRHSSKAPCNSFIILLYYQTNIIFVLHLIDECVVCIFMNVCLCVVSNCQNMCIFIHTYALDSLLIVEHLMRKENICSIICSSHMPDPIT